MIVTQGGVVVVDAPGIPYTPARATMRSTTHSTYEGAILPPSPALAFLCTPKTTELLLEQQRANFASSGSMQSPYVSCPVTPLINRVDITSLPVTPDARRLSFDHVSGNGADDVREFSNTSSHSYINSPPPLVLSSRPHPFSTSLSQPLNL